jgi:hypothetical protein
MITREKIEEILSDKSAFKTKVDHDVTAINLLRLRIPYDSCKSIIGGAEHDVIYLCDVETALPYLDETDASILADCNVGIEEEFECFYLFV